MFILRHLELYKCHIAHIQARLEGVVLGYSSLSPLNLCALSDPWKPGCGPGSAGSAASARGSGVGWDGALQKDESGQTKSQLLRSMGLSMIPNVSVNLRVRIYIYICEHQHPDVDRIWVL